MFPLNQSPRRNPSRSGTDCDSERSARGVTAPFISDSANAT